MHVTVRKELLENSTTPCIETYNHFYTKTIHILCYLCYGAVQMFSEHWNNCKYRLLFL